MKKLLLAIVLIVGCDDAEDEEKSTIGICVMESNNSGEYDSYQCYENENMELPGNIVLNEQACSIGQNKTWHTTYSSCMDYCEQWCSCSDTTRRFESNTLIYLGVNGLDYCSIEEY